LVSVNRFPDAMMIAGRAAFSSILTAASLLALSACTDKSPPSGSTTQIPPEARWVVPSALQATGSLINISIATDSVYVVSGVAELVAHRVSDGVVVWKRSDVPTLMPLIVGDSMFLALVGGRTAAVRLRDGGVLWRGNIPGSAIAVHPAQSGSSAVVTNAAGDVFAVNLTSGATRALATMSALAGGSGSVWGVLAVADTAIVVSQLNSDQGRGAITATRVVTTTGEILSRAILPFLAGEFLTAQREFLIDSLLILPVSGGTTAMNYRTGARAWTTQTNSTGITVRNGLVYSGSGTGDITVLDALTGRVLRRLIMSSVVSGGILDQFPCREGIFFTSGGLWVVPDVAGAAPHRVYQDLFSVFSHAGSTLFASAEKHEVALRYS
jgi:outer membrane protein assembly factor BamB